MTYETTPGREPIQIVEIRQPFCSRTFGVSPCTATGTADQKCLNTRKTCLDPANFATGTPLSLFFSRGDVGAQRVSGAATMFPSLVSVSTAPARLNIAGSGEDFQGIGIRSSCSVVIADFNDPDWHTDPYYAGRSWYPIDPFSTERGTFWLRWLARNPYRQNVQIIVYDGYAGQALADMVKRTYFLEEAVLSGGQITLTAKDILTRVEEKKAQVPVASPGYLMADVSATDTTIEVFGATTSDYPSSGTLRIGSEVMTYTSRAATGNGLRFKGVTRGTDNTAAETHSADDTAQLCWRLSASLVADALEDLLATYAGIDSAWLDDWSTESGDFLTFYRLTGLITEPTPVTDVISEIMQQTLVLIWWDEREALIKFRALHGMTSAPDVLTEGKNIIADSLSITELPDQRASQVWVYWGQTDPTQAVDDKTNYRALSIVADLDSETDERYGEASIRIVYARFLISGAPADTVATRISRNFVETPHEATFRMDAKDRGYWLGDIVQIEHWRDIDAYGVKQTRNWMIVSAEEVIPGEVVEYVAHDLTVAGKVYRVLANGSANYPGAGSATYSGAYIGNSAGLLSDGSDCARIS